MSASGHGHELPMLLFAGFRSLIDRLHAELAAQGHPDVRPVHGFALQAIGSGGATAAELGRRTGVSKQAAGKTIEHLAALGYVSRGPDAADARRRVVTLTDRGWDVLNRSGRILDRLRAQWADAIGEPRLASVESALRAVTGPAALKLDTAGWFGSPG